ncbi:hypothetical protein MHBO_001998 [Bonamia ostreae]|uniref:Uncharacterized protein n=1 Tax=Bonamia ostreae TaxID=126728 RepID=A0ABV2AKZ7_9EUKA
MFRNFFSYKKRWIHRSGRLKGPKSYDPFRQRFKKLGRRKNNPLTTKTAPRIFQKGNRDWKMGKRVDKKYVAFDFERQQQILNFNIPDLSKFKLKPYVSVAKLDK